MQEGNFFDAYDMQAGNLVEGKGFLCLPIFQELKELIKWAFKLFAIQKVFTYWSQVLCKIYWPDREWYRY